MIFFVVASPIWGHGQYGMSNKVKTWPRSKKEFNCKV
jgi:hypothetical protein